MKNLYLITGFLGSGKTTLLKEIFSLYKDRKIAVIVNEFGKEGVDGSVLASHGIEMTEINNGSIFCNCRADMFMDALSAADKADATDIFVETSGLSNPSDIDKVLAELKEYRGTEFCFKGVICTVDAKNFVKVLRSAVSVPYQIEKADLIIINKTDIVDETKVDEVIEKINEISSGKKIVKTSFCVLPSIEIIESLHHEKSESPRMNKQDLLSAGMTIKLPSNLEKSKFETFMQKIESKTYRIKGFAMLDSVSYEIESVCGMTQYIKKESDKYFLVLLYDTKENVRKLATENYKEIFGNAVETI